MSFVSILIHHRTNHVQFVRFNAAQFVLAVGGQIYHLFLFLFNLGCKMCLQRLCDEIHTPHAQVFKPFILECVVRVGTIRFTSKLCFQHTAKRSSVHMSRFWCFHVHAIQLTYLCRYRYCLLIIHQLIETTVQHNVRCTRVLLEFILYVRTQVLTPQKPIFALLCRRRIVTFLFRGIARRHFRHICWWITGSSLPSISGFVSFFIQNCEITTNYAFKSFFRECFVGLVTDDLLMLVIGCH
mmetsp:Transcript_27164/g.44617  ORF Transcript_27164/g.44617 Transcript_27164/m.44617 type:complete len:240 (+) Transcript_27164:84-803(+)